MASPQLLQHCTAAFPSERPHHDPCSCPAYVLQCHTGPGVWSAPRRAGIHMLHKSLRGASRALFGKECHARRTRADGNKQHSGMLRCQFQSGHRVSNQRARINSPLKFKGYNEKGEIYPHGRRLLSLCDDSAHEGAFLLRRFSSAVEGRNGCGLPWRVCRVCIIL